MAQNNWLSNIFKSVQTRRQTTTRTRKRKASTGYTNLGVPSALKPKNIITSLVTRSINQVVRKFIGSIFKSK